MSIRPEETHLILIRHGQTVWNIDRRFQGSNDSPLSELGKRQAEALGQRLAEEEPDLLICSDLGRAVATTGPASRHTGLEPRLDPRLRRL